MPTGEILPYKHRDLNWLSFNKRVLQEAADERNPVYERLKFLAIFSSNLDEYYRVRVSQLRQIKKIKKSLRKKLALKPSKKVKQIIAEVKKQQDEFGEIFSEQLLPKLKENGIHLIEAKDFSPTQKNKVDAYFTKHVAAHVSARLIDLESDPKAFLENNTIYLYVRFKNSHKIGLVNIPVEKLGRFYNIEKSEEQHFITFLDDIIRLQMHQLFPGKQVLGIYEVKLSRDAELYIDDKFSGELAEKIYESLQQRTNGQPTRLLYDASMPKLHQKKFRKHLGLGKIDMMPGGKYHNFSDFFSFPDPTENQELHYKPLPPIVHPAFEASTDYFKTIREKDRLVHYPYMPFAYIENFLDVAAEDQSVVEIKISLYRVADESKLTNSILKALANGKKVTVFVEAKARFDEKNNIQWGKKFEEKGAKVIYSYPKVKVHSKIMWLSRKEADELRYYAYIGTGNFNAETSKLYCDHALFTAHKKITKELQRVFSVLEGDLIIPRTKNLLVSPFNTRQTFTHLILQEMDHAKAGKPAKITAKMNSLEDKEMIDLLYRASEAGVEVRLIVRGFSCLIPGEHPYSKNIYMTSIVGRFLEHGRIYRFHNNGDELLYFGSADWMNRNLDRRIEVLAPVLDAEVVQEFNDILNLQLRDNVKARVHDVKEKNTYVKQKKTEKAIHSQYAIYQYLQEKHQD